MNNIVVITDKNFQTEVLDSLKPTILVFEADWSGACHIINPILNELSIDFKDKVEIGRMDFDKYKRTVLRYNVAELPTLLFFKNAALKSKK